MNKNIIAQIMLKSIQENFERGGRPNPWKLSKRVIKYGGITLTKTGNLKSNLSIDIRGDIVSIVSSTKYSKYINYGSKYMVSRKYMMLQKQDITNIKDYLIKYVIEEIKK